MFTVPYVLFHVVILGKLYQIVDICAASAEPTEDFDALTVGMICVRNLQVSE